MAKGGGGSGGGGGRGGGGGGQSLEQQLAGLFGNDPLSQGSLEGIISGERAVVDRRGNFKRLGQTPEAILGVGFRYSGFERQLARYYLALERRGLVTINRQGQFTTVQYTDRGLRALSVTNG